MKTLSAALAFGVLLAANVLLRMPAFAQEHDHDHAAGEATVAKPHVFLDKSPRIVEYQLRRLSNAQLLLVDRATTDAMYRPVYQAILLRPGMAPDSREEALAGLQAINGTTAIDELLDAFESLSRSDRNQEPVFRQLCRMLTAEPRETLVGRAEALRTAAGADSDALRTAAYAALLAAGLSDEAWIAAQSSDAGRLDFLASIGYVTRGEVRAAQRDHVISCLDASQSREVREAAITTLADVPAELAENFRAAASFAESAELRNAAIRTMLRIPKEDRPADTAETLAAQLVAHIESIPAARRTSDAELDGLQLADELLALVPVDRARAFRERLRAVTVRVVRINTVHEEMRYDKPYFVVEAGRPVQVVMRNNDAMPHNFVITVPGALKEVALIAEGMGTTPGRDGKQYVPDVPQLLWATGMVQPERQQRIVFDAPSELGEYPFVCTFPRHWMRMYGVMLVVPDLDAWLADPKEPADPLGNTRTLVKVWTPDDFHDVAASLRGRIPEIGARLFKEATCSQCHKIRGEGGAVGPELTEVFQRWKGDPNAVLREMLDPSYKVDPKFAMHTLQTADGLVLSGIIKAEDDDTITIITNPEDPKPQVIDRDDIDEMVQSPSSMMPKGLLDRFTQDEVYEILGYVQAAGEQQAAATGTQ